ncbi:MAG: dTDP-4-dehydrorhamnose 3,5-epimerase family protein [Candidatus Rokuibacteriota bacterium]
MILPPGVRLRPLEPHHDRRGWLVEAFRESWAPGVEGAQVNLTWSRAGTLRGSHVHGEHTDYFVLASGRSKVGIRDVRKRSAAFGMTAVVELSSESPSAMIVPPGVLHGLYFPVDSILLTVESRVYDPEEEIRCRWDDPELEIPWPFAAPILSDADRVAQSYREMMAAIEPWQSRYST